MRIEAKHNIIIKKESDYFRQKKSFNKEEGGTDQFDVSQISTLNTRVNLLELMKSKSLFSASHLSFRYSTVILTQEMHLWTKS